MKKYKCKITGTTVLHKSVGEYEVDFGNNSHVNGKVLVNFNFDSPNWKEVVEKDYIITSFCNKGTGAHRPINENGLYGYVEPFKHLNIMLEEGHEIFTVKNKSGIEFKVGDKVRYISKATTNPFTINNFFISDKGLLARSSDDRYATCEFINDIEKVKEPIFISADGHKYFDMSYVGDLFSVCPKASWEEKRSNVTQAINSKSWLHFHTKEARQEYIDNNKPKYSLNDIRTAFSDAVLIGNDSTRIKQFVGNIIFNLEKINK